MILLRLLVLTLTLAYWAPCDPAHASDSAPAIAPEPFFKHPDYSEIHISPSGKYLGALVPIRGRLALAIIDLGTQTSRVVAAIAEQDIGSFAWVNDERLVFSVLDFQAGLGEQRGGGLFAVDRDASGFRELAPTVKKLIDSRQVAPRYTILFSLLHDGGDDVLVLSNELNARYPNVYRMNTRTGRKALLTAGKPGDVVHWVADGKGDVRAAVTLERGTHRRVFWRSSNESPWVELGSSDMKDPQFTPIAFDADGSLIVASDIGRDTRALYRYDTDKKALGELLAAHPQRDLDTGLVIDWTTQRVVGLEYEADRPATVWFDEDWARLQKGVDVALPDHFNRMSRRGSRVLIDSFSDRDPGTYYLLDIDKKRLEPIASRRKAIRPETQPERKPVRYKARDGLEIPGMLTLPVDKPAQSLPLVLYVHGGPWMHGSHWHWSGEPAYLASLGYAVLEPDFRGSTGWGRRLFQAGWKQWGRSMQDDLNDGVDWLAAQGTIDPKRVCIMGASYGGYAVMMGLSRDPERFRCGINYVGVTDIDLMFDVTWSDMSGSDFIRYSAKQLIGDPDKDSAELKAVSPLRNASPIKRPVLMAYGAQDRRVPLIHGERMRNALTAQGTPVEWVVYSEEGHGFLLETNRFDFYRRVAKFLADNLAPAP